LPFSLAPFIKSPTVAALLPHGPAGATGIIAVKGSGDRTMTLRRYWRIIIASDPADWTFRDGTLFLASFPEIRIEREDGGQDYRAPWMHPQDGPVPFLFIYAYWHSDQFVDSLPMVQIDPGLVMPIPHRAETGYAITSAQYHLARLVNLQPRHLDDYLKQRAIAIVPSFGLGAESISERLRRVSDFAAMSRLLLPSRLRRRLPTRTLPSERR
jgi:hypothetical protein